MKRRIGGVLEQWRNHVVNIGSIREK